MKPEFGEGPDIHRERQETARGYNRRLYRVLAALALTAAACSSSAGDSTSDTPPPALAELVPSEAQATHAYSADSTASQSQHLDAEDLALTEGVHLPGAETSCYDQDKQVFDLGAYADAASFAEHMKAWGFDTVHLTIGVDCWQGNKSSIDSSIYRQQVLDMIRQLNERDIVVIVRSHNLLDGVPYEQSGKHDVGTRTENIHFWVDFARTTQALLVAYELPASGNLTSEHCFSDADCRDNAGSRHAHVSAIEETITRIRGTGSEAPIIIGLTESQVDTGDMERLSKLWDNIAASVDVEQDDEPGARDETLSYLTEIVPVIITHSGAASAPSLVLRANREGVGWVTGSPLPGDGLVDESLALTPDGDWVIRAAQAA